MGHLKGATSEELRDQMKTFNNKRDLQQQSVERPAIKDDCHVTMGQRQGAILFDTTDRHDMCIKLLLAQEEKNI